MNNSPSPITVRKTALITGASSGIGYELSKLFARDGYNLILVARRAERLQQLAADLQSKYGATSMVVVRDLAVPGASQEIVAEIDQAGFQIDALVNNAGFVVYGLFHESDWVQEPQMIQVNIVALTELTKLLLPGMVQRGSGRILNVGSTGSFMPCPFNAVYCATKAYVLRFSEALAEELRGTGVTVTALCPGATLTEFHQRADMEEILLLRLVGRMDAATVAASGYRALMKGRRVAVPGGMNKFQILIMRFVPSRVRTAMAKLFLQT